MDAPNFRDLIPSLADWTGDMTPEEWISCVGAFEHAIGYLTVFWPQFVTHDGCVFRGKWVAESEDSYRDFLNRTKGNKQSVEATLNHAHVVSLLTHSPTPTKQQVLFVGEKLREMWQAKLERDFPERRFSVVFNGDEEHEDLGQYEVTFYQEREN